ncbi:MAG: glycosyltransferase [Pantoea sp.]|uniref:glycosyltransferase n=1 Tax=Pantoea sp. TaxID=69393 RepID=UPI0039E608BA
MGIFNSIATSNNAAAASLPYPKGFMVKMGRIAFKKQGTPQKSEYESFLSDLQDLRPDLSEDFIKEILLDQRLYLEKNPDVKNAKLCPVYHYYNYGHKEKRELCAPNFRALKKHSDKTGTQKIVFFDTLKSNASFLYRGFFPEVRNKDSNIIHQETDLITAIKAIFSANEMVFIRPSANSKKTKYFISMCKLLNIKISMNFDDLLIPEFILDKGAVRSEIANIPAMRNNLIKDSAMLLGAEKLILSTNKLGDTFSGFVDEVVVENNRLPYEFFRSKEELRSNINKRNEKINFLYLSGSRTHLKDYTIISGCLIKLAMEFPKRFVINFLGTLNDQTSIFSNLGVETNYIPFVSFEEMMQEIGKNDLVLVPLEKTIFNHAKSNIKFIEAASQGVPVIASKVDEYEAAIESGVNGWLCDTEHQWYETLKAIILDEVNLKKVGLAAYGKAVGSYSV